jgi:hypothetical protein
MAQRNRIAGAVAQNEAHLNDLYAASTTRQASLAEATRRTGAEWGAASQQMTRHGALSSEFIQAAVRGQTSIKEIGNQALVTAGKFGAWTLAATAVYGVVRGRRHARPGRHRRAVRRAAASPRHQQRGQPDQAGSSSTQLSRPVQRPHRAVGRRGVPHGPGLPRPGRRRRRPRRPRCTPTRRAKWM